VVFPYSLEVSSSLSGSPTHSRADRPERATTCDCGAAEPSWPLKPHPPPPKKCLGSLRAAARKTHDKACTRLGSRPHAPPLSAASTPAAPTATHPSYEYSDGRRVPFRVIINWKMKHGSKPPQHNCNASGCERALSHPLIPTDPSTQPSGPAKHYCMVNTRRVLCTHSAVQPSPPQTCVATKPGPLLQGLPAIALSPLPLHLLLLLLQ